MKSSFLVALSLFSVVYASETDLKAHFEKNPGGNGYWAGYKLEGKGKTLEQCATSCYADKSCVAFEVYLPGSHGDCYHFTSTKGQWHPHNSCKAYVRKSTTGTTGCLYDRIDMNIKSAYGRAQYTAIGNVELKGADGKDYGLVKNGAKWTASNHYSSYSAAYIGLSKGDNLYHKKYMHWNQVNGKWLRWTSKTPRMITSFQPELSNNGQAIKDFMKDVEFKLYSKGKLVKVIKKRFPPVPGNAKPWSKLAGNKVDFPPCDEYGKYLDAQRVVGEDEVGPGYYHKAGTYKDALPTSCKFCEGEKCRRHCIQSHVHGLKAAQMTAKSAKLTADLKNLNARKDTIVAELAEANKQKIYHGLKKTDWMTAAQHQNDLDKAIKQLKNSQGLLKDAQKELSSATTTKMAALARRDVSAKKKAVAIAQLAKSTAAASTTAAELKTEEIRLASLQKSVIASQEKIKKLKGQLAHHQALAKTAAAAKIVHTNDEAKHELERKTHAEKEKAAQKRVDKHKTDQVNNNHGELRARAKASHYKARSTGPKPATQKPKFVRRGR